MCCEVRYCRLIFHFVVLKCIESIWSSRRFRICNFSIKSTPTSLATFVQHVSKIMFPFLLLYIFHDNEHQYPEAPHSIENMSPALQQVDI